eukprot:PhM_4_TR15644/c0_g1_i2/m.6830
MEAAPPPSAAPAFTIPESPRPPIESSDFTMHEFEAAIATMKGHTSPGPDGVPIEAFRCPAVRAHALNIINNTLDSPHLPHDLTAGSLVPLYKRKGSTSDPANYRPIVLLPVLTKIIHKMILLRLRASVDDHLLQHQCAYREGHSTQMHILALADLVERACHSSEPLYAVFTDFSKAFDSIDRHHLLQLLRAWGMPLRLVSYLDRAHAQQRLHLRFDGTTVESPIAPAVGVMQGDTLAPYLFILVVDQILRSNL